MKAISKDIKDRLLKSQPAMNRASDHAQQLLVLLVRFRKQK